MQQDKRIVIQIRIDKDTKDLFQQVCKEYAYNSSEVLRQLIVQWTQEQLQEHHRRITDTKK